MMLTLLAALAVQGSDFIVQPYYTYPADQPMHREYIAAINQATVEVQRWYKEKVGVTFRLAPLIVRKGDKYLTMRGGAKPPQEVIDDKQKLPNWWEAQEKVVGGFPDKKVVWIFAQGGGGYAGGNLIRTWAGIAMFGDWVLEPISDVREPLAITADLATWQVKGGVPMGTTVHELGHAFGLHHPDNYPGKTIMRWHGDYPDTGLLPHEIMILRNSPYFVKDAYDPGMCWLNFENQDVMKWGETVTLKGIGFRPTDKVEFSTIPVESFDAAAKEGYEKYVRVDVVDADVINRNELRVKVPEGIGPGFIRIIRARQKSNIVPVNFYKPE